MKKFLLLSGLIALIVAACGGSDARALEVPSRPALSSPVVDTSGTLTPDQITRLSDQITRTRAEKDYQIGVLMIPTLGNDEYLEGYSLKVAREWGIGEKDKDNGALLLIVKNDRKMRIEVGRGLEGELTDVESGRIIRNTLAPAFKKSDYFSGISAGVANIAAQVEGHPERDTSRSTQRQGSRSSGIPVELLIFFFIFGVNILSWIASMFARTKSWWAGGVIGGVVGGFISLVSGWALWSFGALAGLVGLGLILDYLVSRNYTKATNRGDDPAWWAGGPWIGGGWGNGGGDSGGGFGGGDFGGGGASGDW